MSRTIDKFNMVKLEMIVFIIHLNVMFASYVSMRPTSYPATHTFTYTYVCSYIRPFTDGRSDNIHAYTFKRYMHSAYN